MITVRFVTCNDPISAAIRAAEYDFWASHCEALMPDGTLLGAHASGGVQARARSYDTGQFVKEVYVDLPCDDATSQKFYDFLRLQVGKPYDMTAISAFLLGRDWREADSWFCSELQAAALEACGWFASPLATAVNHVSPRDLLLVLSGKVSLVGLPT
jgi:hypothetical protein